jgi:hypothetical protein
MRKLLLLSAVTLPLAACMASPYGYNDPYRSNYGYGYDPVTAVIGALGSGYGGYGFSQAAAGACANVAARYGAPRVTSVRQTSSSRMRVSGYVSRGFGTDRWGCTFRSDGRITDFDI